MSKAIELTKDTFNSEVMEADMPVLVDFWAPWCQPCLMMAPILDELAEDIGDKVKITKLNVNEEQNQALASQYGVQSIPNMKLFKNGEVIGDYVGLRPKEAFKQEIEEAIS
ncbi:MAG: thioredoxin [Patescibacteria group bacterium]